MGSLHRTTFVTAAALICGLATSAFAQDAATLCPGAQELIDWARQHGQDYSDILRQCQSGRQPSQPKPDDPAKAALMQQIKHSVEVADALMKTNPSLGKQCLEAYKDKMDDPSSFQWRGGFVLDETASYINSQMASQKELRGRLVAFNTTVRGKNQFGALVRTSLQCWYVVSGDTMAFDRVTWQAGQ